MENVYSFANETKTGVHFAYRHANAYKQHEQNHGIDAGL